MSDVEPPLWQQLIQDGLIMDITDEQFVGNFTETTRQAEMWTDHGLRYMSY
mgnify:CR=1 FL=1